MTRRNKRGSGSIRSKGSILGVRTTPLTPPTPFTPATPWLPIRVYLRLFAAIAVLLTFFPGCSRRSAGNSASVLRYPISLEPLSLDPAVLNETPTLEMLQNVFEGLVTFDVNNRVVPCLAEKWDYTADGK